jgi:hypothetical protein
MNVGAAGTVPDSDGVENPQPFRVNIGKKGNMRQLDGLRFSGFAIASFGRKCNEALGIPAA